MLKAYFQLCRLSAVFTALADICLGRCLVRREFPPVVEFTGLLVASAGLYLGGMVWNDIFDREVDARERPQRPLPSGRIPVQQAVIFGALLTLAGLGGAALAGSTSLLVALLLTICVFAYDGLLKSTPLGPLAMGLCRMLNVLLGASAGQPHLRDVFELPQVYVAAMLGVYIVGVTIFAHDEAEDSRRTRLLRGGLIANLGLLGLAAWPLGWIVKLGWPIPPGAVSTTSGIALIAVIFLTVNRRIFDAIADPRPARVQAAVRMLLLTLIMLDGGLIHYWVGHDGITWSFATVALLVPALILGKWMSMT